MSLYHLFHLFELLVGRVEIILAVELEWLLLALGRPARNKRTPSAAAAATLLLRAASASSATAPSSAAATTTAMAAAASSCRSAMEADRSAPTSAPMVPEKEVNRSEKWIEIRLRLKIPSKVGQFSQ